MAEEQRKFIYGAHQGTYILQSKSTNTCSNDCWEWLASLLAGLEPQYFINIRDVKDQEVPNVFISL